MLGITKQQGSIEYKEPPVSFSPKITTPNSNYGIFTSHMTRFSFIFVFFFLLVYFSGCKSGPSDEDRPANLVPESEFIGLLVDLSISESAANINIKQVTNLRLDSVYAFNPLEERKIRKSQYDSTLAYYSEHIPEYKAVYDSVLDRISAKQAERLNIKAVEMRK